jgi:VWFA-related protein
MKKRFIVLIAVLPVLAGALVGAQQPSAPPNDPGPLFRVTSSIVLVDAIVLDKESNPVQGLKADDFTVTEDGVRQRITSFSERIPELARPAPPPVLPRYVTTNRPVVTQTNSGNGTAAVLLLDGLNTPPQSQIYVKHEMLRFLARQYDPNIKLAVIALTNKLTVLQDFTQEPVLLRAALDRYLGTTPALARSGHLETPPVYAPAPSVNLPGQATGGLISSGPDPGLPATLAAGGSNASIAEDIAYMMDRFERESENFARDTRIATTLSALEEIARFMSGQNGRKVLLWFSTGFPFSVVGDSPSSMEAERNYGEQIRRTINLLNDANLATYTIDAGGLEPESLGDPSLSGRDTEGKIHHGIDANRALSEQAFQRFSTHEALETIALDTGGRYFGNSNDLDQAIQSALRESTSYYMLGYYPASKRWDRKFREIKVQVNRRGVQLRYRRGYFAVNPSDWRKENGEGKLAAALAANSLPSTQVTFMARALPPGPDADTVVEFAVDPSTLSFETEAENHHRSSLRFEVQAFSPEGKLVKVEVQTAEASLPQPTYERVRKQELPMSVPIRLTPGKYILHLGVRDNLTGLFGTADLPLDVPESKERER